MGGPVLIPLRAIIGVFGGDNESCEEAMVTSAGDAGRQPN